MIEPRKFPCRSLCRGSRKGRVGVTAMARGRRADRGRRAGQMHGRVPQERGKSCRLPRKRRSGESRTQTPGPSGRYLRAGRERSTRYTTGIAKRRKRSAAKGMAGWLSVFVVPLKRGNSTQEDPVEGRNNRKGTPGHGLVGRIRAECSVIREHVNERPTNSSVGDACGSLRGPLAANP